MDKNIAFALGGLAGNNAHGAGFLQAAFETGIEPRMISFSSGQVLWVFRYLQEKTHKEHEPNLRKLLEQELRNSFSCKMPAVFGYNQQHEALST